MGDRLAGKTAFITGAAHGQGRAHAVRFAQEGADVIMIDLEKQGDVAVDYDTGTWAELQETARLVEAEDRRAHAAIADVRDRAALARVFEETAQDFPRLDVICANAGITGHGRILDVTQDDWDQFMDINLTGVFKSIQTFLPRMIDAGNGGSIVMTSSVAGIKGLPFFSAYSAAKHGVIGLMRVLAQELAQDGIRVNAVCPGPIATPMTMNDLIMSLFTDDVTTQVFQGSFASMLPTPDGLAGFIEPENVTDAVLWLASDESRYVTGLPVPVDAGVMVR